MQIDACVHGFSQQEKVSDLKEHIFTRKNTEDGWKNLGFTSFSTVFRHIGTMKGSA